MTPQENLRRALLNDEFPGDAQEDRLFSPTGTDSLRQNRNIALSAWMTQVSGQDINAGSQTWQQDKDALVQGFFKNPTASNVSDDEIHGLVRSHIQTTEEAATMAAESALIGAPLTQMMGGFSLPNISTRQGVSGRMPIYKQDALKRYNALSIKLAPYRNLVNQVSGELRKEMESGVPTTDKLESMAERLLSVNPEDRPLVLKAIGATGGKDAKERASYLSKLAGAMGRMAETMGGSVESVAVRLGGTIQELADAPAAIAGLLSGGTSLQGEAATAKARSEESAAMRDKIDNLTLLTQQIRTIADQEINPIKGDAWYSQIGIDVARMIPQSAVTIANPALGMAANWAYFENTIAGEAMLQDPRLTPQQARSIAGISAPLNAAVETVTALIPFGRIKLPFIQKWLQATATSLPTTAARFGVRAAVGTAAEVGEEYLQARIPLEFQELLGALQKDMPAVDWENRMPKFADIAAQTWGPALVFSLVGAGSVSISEVNSGRALASDVDLMVATGLAPAKAQSIAKAAQANNWQVVDAEFRDIVDKPAVATDTEKEEATQRYLAKIQAHQEVETINAKEAEKIGGVRIFRDDEGWNVELADGSIIKTDSADAARRYRDELYLTELDHEAESMIALSDDLVKAFPGTRLELREEVLEADSDGLTLRSLTTGKTTVIKDAKSLENLWREASAVGFQSGKRTAQAVLGDNFMEFGKSIARVFQRGRGSNDAPAAITAMHEVIEAAWKKGVMAGQWSVEGTRQIIATIVPTLEAGIANLGKETQSQELLWLENAKKAAAEGDEDLIREVFVEMAVRTWIGRDRDGNKTGLRPGTILRALNAAVLQESDPENITMGQKVIEWFKSIGAYLKGVIATANIIRSAERDGTIDDFTGFLDKVLGIETATREENEVKDGVIDMAFSLAPELKDGSTFSLAPTEQDAEVISYERSDKFGSSYLDLKDSNGNWFKVRVSDHDQRTQNPSNKRPFEMTQSLRRTFAITQESPQDISILVDKPLPEQETKDLALAALSTLDSDARSDAIEDGSELEFDAREQYHSLRLQWAKVQTERNGGTPPTSEVRGILEKTPQKLAEAKSLLAKIGDKSSFSLSPQSGIDIVSDTLESWQDVFDKAAKRNPARAMAIRDLAQQRINRLGEMWAADRWTAKGDKIRAVVEKRTKGGLDDEQAMREALRYQELLDAGMMTLTPDVLMAYSEGVGTLEKDPLISTMLNDNGKLMSKSEAARQGLPIKDLYDDAVWLPPQFYAKGGGIMPDVMANNLGFDTASEMWAALESSIKSHRSAKEGYAKAEAAVKAVEQQAREQAKAEAAAWRQEADDMQADDWSPRESLVRDMRVLNVALSAFPPEVRAKITGGSMVKLAGLATERARYKAIQKALEKAIVETEVFMRKEYTEQVDNALDSYRSQKDSSGRISGKLPSQYTELVDYAYRIREASIEDQATESGGLEKALEESESDQQTQSVLTKMGILRLFEAWEMKDSTAMAAASEWLSETIENGKLGRKLLDEDRKAMLDDFRATAKKDAVPEGKISKVDVDNETNNVRFKVFRRAWQGLNGMLDSAVHVFGERLSLVFGDDSKITDHFSMAMIQAANASNDIKREVNRKYHDMLSVVFNSRSRLAHARGIGQMQKVKASGIMITEGRVVEETKLDIETLTKLADGTMTAEAAGLRQDQVDAALEEWAASERKRTVTVETVKNAGEQKERQMTELQGLQWWLWSRQDASRKQMERDGWTDESFAQLDAFLSPEAKALGEWIAKGYDDAARLIDPVYRRLFRAPLPRVKNYAPIYRNRSGDASVMDLDASDISSGLSAGFTKSRVNTVSPLAEMDAVTVMLTHWENVAHWVTHAEAVRDAKAVLLDRDVMTAIKQSSGNVSANSIKQRIAAIESQGTNAAKELHDLNRFWRWLMQYRAFKGLAFRISPVIKQTPALLNPLLADVPAHSYTVGLARAFYDPNAFNREVAEMFKSDTIMRRIEGGFSAEARITMQGEGAIGSVALALMQKGMMPMSWTDGGWTALGAAVSYDYYKRSYMSENPKASTAMADAYATRRLEKMIAVSAQPSDIVNRSLVEASPNNFMRSLWMFASDQRKALGIEVTALKKLLSGKSKNKAMDVQRIIVAHFAQTAMSQLMASIMASFLGDDEDKEREWSREQWTLSLALGPINGLFVLGRMIDMTGRRILNMQAVQDAIGTGVKLPIFTNKTLFEQGVNDIWNGATSVDDLFNPEDPDDFIGAMESLAVGGSTAISMAIGPQAGVIDVTANLVREGNKVIKAMSDEK